MPLQAMDLQVGDALDDGGIGREEAMPTNEPASRYCCTGPTHDEELSMIWEALEIYGKGKLTSLIDHRYEKDILALFEVAQERAKRFAYIPTFEAMETTPIKTFFTGGVDVLLDGDI